MVGTRRVLANCYWQPIPNKASITSWISTTFTIPSPFKSLAVGAAPKASLTIVCRSATDIVWSPVTSQETEVAVVCATVKVSPAIVIWPVRAAPVVLAAIENCTVPLIVYRNRETLMSVAVEWNGPLAFGTPRLLFSGPRSPAGATSGSRPPGRLARRLAHLLGARHRAAGVECHSREDRRGEVEEEIGDDCGGHLGAVCRLPFHKQYSWRQRPRVMYHRHGSIKANRQGSSPD